MPLVCLKQDGQDEQDEQDLQDVQKAQREDDAKVWKTFMSIDTQQQHREKVR